LKRLPDWPERLIALLNARAHAPFAWGRQDCASFAADAVQAMTGVDPIADLRGYTARDAIALLRTPIEQLVAARFPSVPAGLARRGDIGVVEINGRPSVVVIEGEHAVGAGERGLVRAPRTALVSTFAVG
jgi:hypothetical protein